MGNKYCEGEELWVIVGAPVMATDGQLCEIFFSEQQEVFH